MKTVYLVLGMEIDKDRNGFDVFLQGQSEVCETEEDALFVMRVIEHEAKEYDPEVQVKYSENHMEMELHFSLGLREEYRIIPKNICKFNPRKL